VPRIWPKIWRRNRQDAEVLPIRRGSAVKRDVYKAATAGFTGFTAFGALAVTGAVAGVAAHQQALDQARKDAVRPPVTPAPAQVVTKRRKHRKVIRTQVVHAVSTVGVASTGSGGTITRSSTSSVTHHYTSTSHSAPKPAPKPAPAPAPSSGS